MSHPVAAPKAKIWGSLWSISTGFYIMTDLDLLNKNVIDGNLVRPLLTPLGGGPKSPLGPLRPKNHRFQLSSNESQMTRFELPQKKSHGTDLTRPPEHPPYGTISWAQPSPSVHPLVAPWCRWYFYNCCIMGATLTPIMGVRRGLTRLVPFRLIFRGPSSVTLQNIGQF
jgi:hypothetical protein